MLFGRVNYKLMVSYWRDVVKNKSDTGALLEYARVFDSLDEVVFSTTLEHVEGDKTRVVRSGIAREVLSLKSQTGKDIFYQRFERCFTAFTNRFD
jgi:dihydrofolate reductase